MRFAIALTLALFTTSIFADDFIVIVYDTSGSMNERMSGTKTRMQVGQEALINVLSQTPSSTKVGVLTFDGWIYELGKVDRQKLTGAITGMRSGGGTPLYEHIRAGATRLLEERRRQNNIGNYKLVVVTDGSAGDSGMLNSRGEIPGVMDDIAMRNITVDAIGLDMEGDHPIKKIIAEKGLGSYMSGDDPSSLKVSLEKAVAEVNFGDKDDAGEDAFAVLEDLPDEFFVLSIKGLSTFPNHPIGELPPVAEVLPDGSLAAQAPVNQEAWQPQSGTGFFKIIFGFICFMFFAIVLVTAIAGRRI